MPFLRLEPVASPCLKNDIELSTAYPILVIEDDPKIAHIVKVCVEGAGYRGVRAERERRPRCGGRGGPAPDDPRSDASRYER
jgi:hypothetical protein